MLGAPRFCGQCKVGRGRAPMEEVCLSSRCGAQRSPTFLPQTRNPRWQPLHMALLLRLRHHMFKLSDGKETRAFPLGGGGWKCAHASSSSSSSSSSSPLPPSLPPPHKSDDVSDRVSRPTTRRQRHRSGGTKPAALHVLLVCFPLFFLAFPPAWSWAATHCSSPLLCIFPGHPTCCSFGQVASGCLFCVPPPLPPLSCRRQKGILPWVATHATTSHGPSSSVLTCTTPPPHHPTPTATQPTRQPALSYPFLRPRNEKRRQATNNK